MTFGRYMRSALGECILVVLAAWSVCTVAMNAFYLDGMREALGYWGRSLLALGAVSVLAGVLYFAAWNRRRMAAGLVIYAVLVAALLFASVVLSSGENPYEDAEGNFLYLAALLAVATTACFALSRTLAGCAVWFAAAAISCSVVQAFYESGEVAMSMVAVFSSLALIVHRNFRLGLLRAESAGMPSHGRMFWASVAPVAAVAAVALLAWFAVIAPMSPDVAKVTLVTDYRQLPVDELKGTAEERPVLNYDMKTENLIDGFRYTTDDLKEDPQSDVEVDARSMLEQQLQQRVDAMGAVDGGSSGSGSREDFDWDAPDEEYDPISWSETFPWIAVGVALAVLLVAAVTAYFVGRRVRRRRRLEHMLCLPPRAQVEAIYQFLISRMERVGLAVPDGVTLGEYARASARQMEVMDDETKVAFADVTAAYERCAYGHVEPTEDDVVPLAAYYLGFWRAARAHLGSVKYFFKSFRL